MRLPNLLEHETINEAIHHSTDWRSLLQLNCHPDTQLFLCSLFAPICLPTMDKEILPCRSLCQAVKQDCEMINDANINAHSQGCEGRMSIYGFPWPQMLSCEKYPEDNDMCIKTITSEKQGKFTKPMGRSVEIIAVSSLFSIHINDDD
ncbi:fz domain protein [Dictyocaulus viviparus]|uniref:Fz domain protein n=1 Tax=Dictyocaulus viviparus TaxID=29172 RepID=A0A0D8YCD1_DICVI|nr:fz domain protein [Dictyocaulus viviparus]